MVEKSKASKVMSFLSGLVAIEIGVYMLKALTESYGVEPDDGNWWELDGIIQQREAEKHFKGFV